MSDDEWSEHVANGEAYAGAIFVTGVPGELPFVQLLNPVGSGMRIRVRVLQPFAVFAIGVNHNLRRHDPPLASSGFFAGPENLLGGGDPPLAQARFTTQVAMIGSRFWLFLSAGNTRKDYPNAGRDWGHDLLPGQGLMASGAVGGFVFNGWQWAEVSR